MQNIGQPDGIGRYGTPRKPAAAFFHEAAALAAGIARGVRKVLVERAPFAQRFEQLLAVLLADGCIQSILPRRLRQKFGHVSDIVRLDLPITLRLAPERTAAVQI